MNINGKHYRTIWLEDDETIAIIDQRLLPFEFKIVKLKTVDEVATAIFDMYVRGAGCIGATAGYGMYIACLEAAQSSDFDSQLIIFADRLKATRPTAVNLAWAVDRQLEAIKQAVTVEEKISTAKSLSETIADEDARWCRQIGEHGLKIIEGIATKKPKGETINILTHCNAGWLAFVDYGSATSPIYAAHDAGIPVHVWVDETRPRNQGARLTAWELGMHGVPHTIIPDNTGGHLMQHGQVDMVITGTDRTTKTGDVANKIGTYLKALAAKDNNVPFYVALPSSTFDWEISDGIKDISIEKRNPEEVTIMEGILSDKVEAIRITPENSPAANYAFDVTPARLVTGLITERGLCDASAESIAKLYK